MTTSHGQPLEELGATLAAAWSLTLGRPCSARSVQLKGDILTITLGGLLTDSELALARQPAGHSAIRQRLDDLLQAVYPTLARSVEERLCVPLAESHMACDPATGAVTCRMRLQAWPVAHLHPA